jgi:hypothetical protein
MNSEPVIVIGAVLAAMPALTALAHLAPPPWGQIVAGLLSAIGAGLVGYLRGKVTPAVQS